jgi:hypothetical protein
VLKGICNRVRCSTHRWRSTNDHSKKKDHSQSQPLLHGSVLLIPDLYFRVVFLPLLEASGLLLLSSSSSSSLSSGDSFESLACLPFLAGILRPCFLRACVKAVLATMPGCDCVSQSYAINHQTRLTNSFAEYTSKASDMT